MSFDLRHVSREEFAEAMAAGLWLIIPLGATEAHGPHLPLGSDTIQAEYVARAVAREVGGLVAPGIPYGLCRSTRNFPGTISLSFGTAEAVVREILTDYVRHGARKILILSGHAGGAHLEAVREAALRLVERDERVTILVIGPSDLALPPSETAPIAAGDGHAGAWETSVMLAIDAGRVRRDRLPSASRPRVPAGQILAHPERSSPSGVMGDPRGASPEAGARLLSAYVAETVRILRENPSGGAR